MTERRRPGMPADAHLMNDARVAAIIVNEHEQRRQLDGIPVPDSAYLDLARTTELVSRARPILTGGVYVVAAEAIAYYNLAGAFDAAVRLGCATLPNVMDNPGLRSYISELIEEARNGKEASGSRTEDPFDPAVEIEKRRTLYVVENQEFPGSSLTARGEIEERQIREFEIRVDQLPTPDEPEVDVFEGPYDRAPDPEIEIERVGARKVLVPGGKSAPTRTEIVTDPKKDSNKNSYRGQRQFGLTPLQIQTLDAYIQQGMPSSAELAKYLGITRNAVSVRFSFILSDLGVSGRREAVEHLLAARKMANGRIT